MRGLLEGMAPATRPATLQVALAEMLDATGAAAESAALIEDGARRGPHPRSGAEAARPHRHRRRPARRRDPGHAHRADRRAARPRGDDDHGFAHEREGDRALMGERLALAVELSNRGAGGIAALRHLPDAGGPPRPGRGRGRRRAAPRPREPRPPQHARPHPPRAPRLGPRRAGRRPPARPGPRATRWRRRWRRPRRRPARGEGRPAEAAALLEGSGGGGGGGTADGQALADLVRAQLAAGEPEAARRALEAALADDPASLPARFLQAGLDAPKAGTPRPRRSTAR